MECDWDTSTLLPDMEQLRREVQRGVKMVVITTPGEPPGVFHDLCRTAVASTVVHEQYRYVEDVQAIAATLEELVSR